MLKIKKQEKKKRIKVTDASSQQDAFTWFTGGRRAHQNLQEEWSYPKKQP